MEGDESVPSFRIDTKDSQRQNVLIRIQQDEFQKDSNDSKENSSARISCCIHIRKHCQITTFVGSLSGHPRKKLIFIIILKVVLPSSVKRRTSQCAPQSYYDRSINSFTRSIVKCNAAVKVILSKFPGDDPSTTAAIPPNDSTIRKGKIGNPNTCKYK